MISSPMPQRLTPEEQARRSRRSLAIGVALGLLALMFYVVSMIKVAAPVTGG